jgi:hypothetical protein
MGRLDRFLPALLLVLLLPLLLLLASGCTFHRVITNEGVRDLDPSGLVIGKSNWRDCIRELGLPAASTSEQVGQELPTLRFFSYTCTDRKTAGFVITRWISVPLQWSDEQSDRQLVVEFDTNGMVKDLYATEKRAIWRPLQGESPRESHSVRDQEEWP